MKSFTDLKQSKKLAEILPLESADMYYTPPLIKGHTDYIPHLKRKLPIDWDIEQAVPCWSLSALLNVLPRFIEFKGDKYYLRFMKEYVEYANDEISITGRYLHTTGNDNLVDACVEMILKLHELNLLRL